jgi:recyclin-1
MQSNSVFLQASAASFRESWRLVDAILRASEQRPDYELSKEKAEDVVSVQLLDPSGPSLLMIIRRYRMFEVNMDEYLDEEIESTKHMLESICRSWEQQVQSFMYPCFFLYLNKNL